MQKVTSLVLLTATSGCVGVYAEVAATKFTTAQVSGAMDTDVGATTVAFSVGAEFSNTNNRLSMGYLSDAITVDGGEATLAGGTLRFDRAIKHIGERFDLRLGAGLDFGSGEATFGGDTTEVSGNGFFGGLGANYFATWRTPVSAFVGFRYLNQDLGDADLHAKGVTVKLAVSYQFHDPRPDVSLVVPLERSNDITGVIERGASARGCTSNRFRTSTTATLDVVCDGRRIEFFQIAQGMMVTCYKQPSKSKCDDMASDLVKAGVANVDRATTPPAEPAAAPAAAPAPAEPATPAATPAEPESPSS